MKTNFTKLTSDQLKKITGGSEVNTLQSRAYFVTTSPVEPPLEDDGNRGGGRP